MAKSKAKQKAKTDAHDAKWLKARALEIAQLLEQRRSLINESFTELRIRVENKGAVLVYVDEPNDRTCGKFHQVCEVLFPDDYEQNKLKLQE